MREVVLAVLAQVGAVGVNDGGGVVEEAGDLLLEDGHDHHHAVLPGQVLHQADGRSVGHRLRQLPPPVVLLGGEVGAGEQLLEAEDLDAPAGGLLDQRNMLVQHEPPQRLDVLGRVPPDAGLDQTGPHHSWHVASPSFGKLRRRR